jgi:hypothetical protein
MKWLATFLVVCGLLSVVSGQVVVSGGMNPESLSFGPVSILITSPETGPGLGPKFDLGQEFTLGFKVQVSNLTVSDLHLEILQFDDRNETYVPFNQEWVVSSTNASMDVVTGPTVLEGGFDLQIPERGYYFLKVRANYTLAGREQVAEGGDLIYGPRLRVIPSLGQRSYVVLIGMPIVPLVAGVGVRAVRRRETRQRRRKKDPEWLEELKSEEKRTSEGEE